MNANFRFCDYFTKSMCLGVIMAFAVSCSKSDFDEEIHQILLKYPYLKPEKLR